jgi:UDP-N-acetylglucosamine 2-epimerase (non-hydrolysing)
LRILHIVGARPNFVKATPIIREMALYPGEFQQRLLHTGQHYQPEMSKVFFDELDLPRPDINLEVGSGSHVWQTAQIMTLSEPIILEYQPDWVVVYGDVNSTLAVTLVCSKLGIKVAHVEAGLRSFDRSMPEEINRLVTDQIAELLFTPSADADRNLIREGIAEGRIRLVGNVMIDTLVRLLPKAKEKWAQLSERYPTERYILVTLHRPSNVDHPDTLSQIISALEDISLEVPILFPVHPRTRASIDKFGFQHENPQLQLLEPLGYLDFLALQIHASLVLTDSGGIQEETTYLGVPCLTARANTERPVTIELGTNQLVESRKEPLVKAMNEKLSEPKPLGNLPPYWDGQTASRVVRVFQKS